MKPTATKFFFLAGLISSDLLLCACTSAPSTGHASTTDRSAYATKTGTLATAWGQLPTYGHQPGDLRQFKDQFSWLPVFFAGIDNSATVDVLVNRDGTVRDVAIVRSSGDPDKDSSVLSRISGVRITTNIAPGDPAPYVFRTVVALQKNPGDSSSLDYYSYTSPQGQDPGNSNTVNGFVR